MKFLVDTFLLIALKILWNPHEGIVLATAVVIITPFVIPVGLFWLGHRRIARIRASSTVSRFTRTGER